MIYSRWHADRGGYDLYRDPSGTDLGNDLPTPLLVPSSPIGVASVEIGRSPAFGAPRVGVSALPVGSIMPVRSRLLGRLGEVPGGASGLLMLGVGVAVGYALTRSLKL